jgi:hypothetical protein
MSNKKSTLIKKCALFIAKQLNCYKRTERDNRDVRSIYIFRKFVFLRQHYQRLVTQYLFLGFCNL